MKSRWSVFYLSTPIMEPECIISNRRQKDRFIVYHSLKDFIGICEPGLYDATNLKSWISVEDGLYVFKTQQTELCSIVCFVCETHSMFNILTMYNINNCGNSAWQKKRAEIAAGIAWQKKRDVYEIAYNQIMNKLKYLTH